MDSKNEFFSGSPKTMFFSGFIAGIAIFAVITSLYLANLTMNDKGMPAQAEEKVEAAVDDIAENNSPELNIEAILTISDSDHILGSKDAEVVLIEYSDFQCPYCGRHAPNLKKLYEELGDDIAIVFRHFPLSFHANALSAAVASECAAEQGKFWEYHDALFANQSDLGKDLYEKIATDLGLNISDFNECLDSGKYENEIKAEMEGGSSAGVTGTPGTFVNGNLVKGAVPYETLKSIVESELE